MLSDKRTDRQKKLQTLLDQGASPQVDPKGLASATSLGKWAFFRGRGLCVEDTKPGRLLAGSGNSEETREGESH